MKKQNLEGKQTYKQGERVGEMAAYDSFKAFLTSNGETITLAPGSNTLGRGNEFGIHDRRVRYSFFLCLFQFIRYLFVCLISFDVLWFGGGLIELQANVWFTALILITLLYLFVFHYSRKHAEIVVNPQTASVTIEPVCNYCTHLLNIIYLWFGGIFLRVIVYVLQQQRDYYLSFTLQFLYVIIIHNSNYCKKSIPL